jgi:microsomal dipeptidase-like Zn-dependent dipeptidase
MVRWLVAHDYSDEQITKVLGENILRAMATVWIG